jgi:hypothetical protein
MKDDSHLYLDIETLRRRGWTEALIKKFLGEPDRRIPVDHWANFTGKSVYFLGRVEGAESDAEFQTAFQKSLHRRRIDQAGVANFMAERAKTAGAVDQWANSMTEDDLRRMEVSKRIAEIFQEARARGFRTPHKA